MNESPKISKTLSYWLRHAPEAGGMTLDGAGWTSTEAVLVALRAAGLPGTPEDLERVVSQSDKNRFELSPSRERIRARQGHSVDVEGDWQVATPPKLLFHGTVDRFLDSILIEGLVAKARHHVHLSPDLETARRVGARRGKPAILEIMAGDLADAGMTFYVTGNGVWLTDHVPATALRRLE
jgi:putative RNA 2'-phosphotransferase